MRITVKVGTSTLAHATGQPLCRLDGSKLRRFEPTSLPQK